MTPSHEYLVQFFIWLIQTNQSVLQFLLSVIKVILKKYISMEMSKLIPYNCHFSLTCKASGPPSCGVPKRPSHVFNFQYGKNITKIDLFLTVLFIYLNRLRGSKVEISSGSLRKLAILVFQNFKIFPPIEKFHVSRSFRSIVRRPRK